MQVTYRDRVRMERAHVRAWPALRMAEIDGWHRRGSGGGSQRANSVSTIDFAGSDVQTAIDTVEARYRALGMPPQFQTFEDTAPAELPFLLHARGYQTGRRRPRCSGGTMFKRIVPTAAPADVECRDHAWQEWCDVYLAAIIENRRAVNQQILSAPPNPHAFFACGRDGAIISTGLCVVSFGCAVIECVATRPDARRQGGAMAVLRAILSRAAQQDAGLIGLQVVTSNLSAVRLCEGLGFVAGATKRFWVLKGDDGQQ